MKVSELINYLSEENPNAEVILSKDAEGNEYSPLDDLDPGFYIRESTWSGEFITPSEREDDTKYEPAVCLWPVN